jgi:hypothetical protein
MNFWINFWTVFFIISLVLFAALAVTVTIGGFFNIRSLFKNLTKQSEQSQQTPVDENSPAES